MGMGFLPSINVIAEHAHGPSPEFRERTQIRFPSPREAVGRGRGWGVAPRVPMLRLNTLGPQLRWTPRYPPPPTPPRHAQGRVGGGEFKSGASLGRDDGSFRFKFQTADMRPRPRGAISPEFCGVPPKRREQGMPDARCTRGLVCKMDQGKRTRAYRFSGGTPAFPAQWLYGL